LANVTEEINILPRVNEHTVERRDAIANGVTLRILPLGASIVYGYASADGNGMRYGLRSALVKLRNKVGSQSALFHLSSMPFGREPCLRSSHSYNENKLLIWNVVKIGQHDWECQFRLYGRQPSRRLAWIQNS
jgi:hypothetical protein